MSPQSITLERFERTGDVILHDALSLEAEKHEKAEADRIASEECARAEQIGNIQLGLEDLCERIRSAQTRAIDHVAKSVGDAAATLFPALALEAFAEEVAAATSRLIKSGSLVQPRLHVATTEHDKLVELLSGISAPHEVTVISDDAIQPGLMNLSWEDGGAEFDAEALGEAALKSLSSQLKYPNRSQIDE